MVILHNHRTQFILPIAAYCGSSILMTVTNKFVLSGYGFNLNFLLLAIQSWTCVLMLRWFHTMGLVQHRPYHSEDARRWLPVSCGLVAMIYTGSKALQYMSIPLFTIFKNLTIIMIAYGERMFLKGPMVTNLVLFAFALMVVSSIIAGWADISAGKILKDKGAEVGVVTSYFWMILNCASSATFALLMRSRIKSVGFKDFDTVYYNNLLSVPILLICSFLTEWGPAWDLLKKYGFIEGLPKEELVGQDVFWRMWMAIIVSSVASFAISYSSSWCVRVTSSTTYSMVGALNKLPIAIAGMVLFEDPVTFGSVAGVMIAFTAGLIYSYAKSAKTSPAASLSTSTTTRLTSPTLPTSSGTSSASSLFSGSRAREGYARLDNNNTEYYHDSQPPRPQTTFPYSNKDKISNHDLPSLANEPESRINMDFSSNQSTANPLLSPNSQVLKQSTHDTYNARQRPANMSHSTSSSVMPESNNLSVNITSPDTSNPLRSPSSAGSAGSNSHLNPGSRRLSVMSKGSDSKGD